MFLVTVTIRDAESKYSHGCVFGLSPGHNVKRIPLDIPMVDKDGVVLYTMDVVYTAHKEPAAPLEMGGCTVDGKFE